MLRQSKVERTGLIQAKLLELPLGGPKESPKVTLTRAELVLFMVKDLKGAGEPTKKLMDFGLSALAHPNASVRKLSERILLALYAIDPEGVRKRLPEEAYANKKKSDNSALKKLVEEFDKRDRRAWEQLMINILLSLFACGVSLEKFTLYRKEDVHFSTKYEACVWVSTSWTTINHGTMKVEYVLSTLE